MGFLATPWNPSAPIYPIKWYSNHEDISLGLVVAACRNAESDLVRLLACLDRQTMSCNACVGQVATARVGSHGARWCIYPKVYREIGISHLTFIKPSQNTFQPSIKHLEERRVFLPTETDQTSIVLRMSTFRLDHQ